MTIRSQIKDIYRLAEMASANLPGMLSAWPGIPAERKPDGSSAKT
jgi:hypothetical protein